MSTVDTFNLPLSLPLLAYKVIINLSCSVKANNPSWDNNFSKLSVRALISGEHPEAMQTGSCGKSQSFYIIISLTMLITLWNFVRKELFLSASPQFSSSSPCVPFRVLSNPPLKDGGGSSSTVSVINFKLESEEGVGKLKLYQRVFIYSKSWLSKQREQYTEKDAS